MTEDDFEKGISKYTSTSGHKKLMNYVQALFEDPKFIEDVKEIRKKVGIVSGKDHIPLTEAGVKKATAYHKAIE